MRNDNINDKLKLLPDNPGCYLMKNKDGVVIYVGKAKILKNRVKSYFIGSHNAKTTLLVSEIEDFEYIITKSELESLVLELNLIKKYAPKYNIKLMDDKTYPYIIITNEENPKLQIVRNSKKKGQLFGPYPNVTAARSTIKLLNTLYPFRKCYTIPNKECLYFHMGQCLAPCINKISRKDYEEYLKKTISFLKGETKEVIKELKERMNYYSEKLEFENAKECLDLINSINETVEKQKIVVRDCIDRDIFGYYEDEIDVSIYVLYMRQGKIIGTESMVLEKIMDAEEIFGQYVGQFYQTNPLPKEVLFPDIKIEGLDEFLDNKVFIPQKGEKLDIVNMAMENAKLVLENQRELNRNKNELRVDALNSLSNLLRIKYPRRIEAFDNSNIFGSDAVGAMVCFIDGRPDKNEYRKYRIKTVDRPDDYATTKEVIYRRYYKMLLEGTAKPDLIIMDGGKGHYSAVMQILNDLNLDIQVIGLKKDDNHKTETLIYNNEEYNIKKDRNLYQFLFMVQEEVHRFAISFHKTVRAKSMFLSKLDGIKGLGPKGKEKLLLEFTTIENMKKASKEDFEKIGLERIYEEVIEKISRQ